MDRRAFLGTLGLLAAPLPAEAQQQATKSSRIGCLRSSRMAFGRFPPVSDGLSPYRSLVGNCAPPRALPRSAGPAHPRSRATARA